MLASCASVRPTKTTTPTHTTLSCMVASGTSGGPKDEAHPEGDILGHHGMVGGRCGHDGMVDVIMTRMTQLYAV